MAFRTAWDYFDSHEIRAMCCEDFLILFNFALNLDEMIQKNISKILGPLSNFEKYKIIFKRKMKSHFLTYIYSTVQT